MNRSPSTSASSFIEIGIWEEPEPKDAGGFSINFLVDSFRFGLRGLVEPEPAIHRASSGFKTRLVDDSESVKSLAARYSGCQASSGGP